MSQGKACMIFYIYYLISMSGKAVVHKFIRGANLYSELNCRVANRFDPFKNTLTVLEDPQHSRKLYLIGTTNSSTLLAHRTKKLLSEIKPDAVYTQTSQEWWNYAQHVSADHQKLFSQISKDFKEEPYKHENNYRGVFFRVRYNIWKYFFNSFCRFPEDFNAFTPGLETYFALKYASENKVQSILGGNQFDPITVEAFRTQPDLYPHTMLYRGMAKFNQVASSWTDQYNDFFNTLHTRGGEAFAESIDRSRINFFVQMLKKTAPKQKKILIDDRDQRIFRDLYETKAKNIVAVVNQWHQEGVETHWRRITGTEIIEPQLSPIADMDIDAIQEKCLVNEWLREHYSKVTKSEPATWQDYSLGYHKENYQYERTRHTHHDSHEDIPEPGQEKINHHH